MQDLPSQKRKTLHIVKLLSAILFGLDPYNLSTALHERKHTEHVLDPLSPTGNTVANLKKVDVSSISPLLDGEDDDDND